MRMDDSYEQDVTPGNENMCRDIPKFVKDTVIAAHNRLGHPTRKTLLKMMRLAGSHPQAIKFAKVWNCPTCAQRSAPGKPRATKGEIRPYSFNHSIYIDIKFVQDVAGTTHAALSIVDAGTAFHRGVLLRTKAPRYVARKIMRHWISLFGAPLRIIHDQGGEFEKDVVNMMEELSIEAEVTASHASWQLAMGERHGGMFGTIWQAVITEHQCSNKRDVKLALDAALLAKNTTVTRNGHNAYQAVLGQEPRDPTSAIADNDDTDLSSRQMLGPHSEVGRAASMRHTAKMAILKLDVSDKLRRAISRGPPDNRSHQHEYLPGSRIYFWEPHASKGRQRQDPGRWRGPALIILREKHQRYFVSWHGRLLLLAAENIRPASTEEAAAFDLIYEEAETFTKEWTDKGEADLEYEDKTQDDHPPEVPPEKQPQSMLKGLKSVKKFFLKDAPRKRPEPPALLQRNQEVDDDYEPTEGGAASEPVEFGPHAAEAPVTPAGSDEESESDPEQFWKSVHGDEDTYIREDDNLTAFRRAIRNKRTDAEAQAESLNDVPLSFKRVLDEPTTTDAEATQPAASHEDSPIKIQEPEPKRVKESFIAGIMAAALGGSHANAWMNKDEIHQLRRILGMPGITCARIHKMPRKRLEKLPVDRYGKSLKRSRLSILIGEEASDVFVLDHRFKDAVATKMTFPWKGMSIFYHERPPKPKNVIYFQTPQGIAKTTLHENDVKWFQQEVAMFERECRLRESYYLRLKQSGKELDPRCFDKTENKAFQDSDRKEWESWIKNETVRLLSRKEALKIPKAKIFKIPLRFVRTNRALNTGKLIAKSRLVAPGHQDPGLGEFRTDAPTTDPLAVNLTKSIAASLDWHTWVFDVETAFLSGKNTDREIYVRAPKEGLPATKSTGYIPPFSLMRVLKSIYGLTEAPRLWYLRAREIFEECGYTELKMSKSTFVLIGPDDMTHSICNLHVDDGFLVGDVKSKTFNEAFEKIKSKFSVKEWTNLRAKTHKYLGVYTWQNSDGSITESMEKYIQEIKTIPVKRGDPEDRDLSPPETKAFRSLVMKLRWPAQKLLTQVLYGVSALAQKVNEAKVKHVKEINKLVKVAKDESDAGRARITHRPLNLAHPCIVTYFDASLGKEDGYKSQAGMITFATDNAVLQEMTNSNRVEHHSKRITRVVKSSLAAESAGLSMAVDKHLYSRVLFQALMYGEARIGADWRKDLTVEGFVVTDARALYDHVTTTGSLPAERATMMDLLAAKEMIEQALFTVRWVPTQHQFADHLTKTMTCELNRRYLGTGQTCLIQTGADAEREEHKAKLRKAQRERRKARMKAGVGKTSDSTPKGVKKKTPTKKTQKGTTFVF